MSEPRATGRCLCGAVRYEVHGLLRDVLICHCEECRRWGGYLGAFSSARLEHFVLVEESALQWIDSPRSDRRARRGFCRECGASLFWQPTESERINIAAGTLDQPTGLRIAGHFYAQHAADYDSLPADGLPRYPDPTAPEVAWR